MFYDLNLLWSTNEVENSRTAAFAAELGYSVIAFSHLYNGKLPSDLTPPIPANPFPALTNLKILRRATLVIDDTAQNHRISALNAAYDLVAARPTNEKAFALACTQLDVDIVSIDCTIRRPFVFKFKPIAVAISRGIRIELCYGSVITSTDPNAKANVISNAIQIIRASRSRGLVIGSEASGVLALRSPYDVINLAAVWGLPQDKGRSAISNEWRNVAINARMKRETFRGAVELVSGGSVDHLLPAGAQKSGKPEEVDSAKNELGQNKKRKADDTLRSRPNQPPQGQMSKRAMKREAKKAKLGNDGSPNT